MADQQRGTCVECGQSVPQRKEGEARVHQTGSRTGSGPDAVWVTTGKTCIGSGQLTVEVAATRKPAERLPDLPYEWALRCESCGTHEWTAQGHFGPDGACGADKMRRRAVGSPAMSENARRHLAHHADEMALAAVRDREHASGEVVARWVGEVVETRPELTGTLLASWAVLVEESCRTPAEARTAAVALKDSRIRSWLAVVPAEPAPKVEAPVKERDMRGDPNVVAAREGECPVCHAKVWANTKGKLSRHYAPTVPGKRSKGSAGPCPGSGGTSVWVPLQAAPTGTVISDEQVQEIHDAAGDAADAAVRAHMKLLADGPQPGEIPDHGLPLTAPEPHGNGGLIAFWATGPGKPRKNQRDELHAAWFVDFVGRPGEPPHLWVYHARNNVAISATGSVATSGPADVATRAEAVLVAFRRLFSVERRELPPCLVEPVTIDQVDAGIEAAADREDPENGVVEQVADRARNIDPAMLGRRRVPLDDIVEGYETQARESADDETISEYTAQMGAGAIFPPVKLFFDGSAYWIGDGDHRTAAAKDWRDLGGPDDIDADVEAGGQREALLYSCGANQSHGLRRTNADKRNAVRLLLVDTEWSTWSDREIARRTGTTHPFVAKVRAELAPPKPVESVTTPPPKGRPLDERTTQELDEERKEDEREDLEEQADELLDQDGDGDHLDDPTGDFDPDPTDGSPAGLPNDERAPNDGYYTPLIVARACCRWLADEFGQGLALTPSEVMKARLCEPSVGSGNWATAMHESFPAFGIDRLDRDPDAPGLDVGEYDDDTAGVHDWYQALPEGAGPTVLGGWRLIAGNRPYKQPAVQWFELCQGRGNIVAMLERETITGSRDRLDWWLENPPAWILKVVTDEGRPRWEGPGARPVGDFADSVLIVWVEGHTGDTRFGWIDAREASQP